jgi:CHAT domain-containing protein
VVTSYTPTLTSLLRAQRARAPVPVHDVKLVLLPASPTSSGRFTALPKVETEVNLVADIASRAKARPKILSADKAKTKKIAKALEAASIVHLACHGTQDAGSPLQSAFHLSGKRRLAVSDLMELDLKHAHLAFLSACETAKGDREQPDQAIHLAATMLFLGFRSVVGTMWSVHGVTW